MLIAVICLPRYFIIVASVNKLDERLNQFKIMYCTELYRHFNFTLHYSTGLILSTQALVLHFASYPSKLLLWFADWPNSDCYSAELILTTFQSKAPNSLALAMFGIVEEHYCD